jgi:hypothetical protein
MTKGERIGHYLSYLMQALILVYSVYSFYIQDFLWAIGAIFAFFLTITPTLLKKRFYITLPWELNLLIVLALFIHVSGNIRGWYEIFYPFYDKIAHFIASSAVAILGFISAVIFDQYTEIKINRALIIFFIIIFTMAIGSCWEIGEFLSDKSLGTSFQHGLDDTMWDLMFDLIGGLVVGILGTVYLRKLPKEHFLRDIGIENR